jgi:peroxiredoxin
MIRALLSFAFALTAFTSPVRADSAVVGKPAPNFTLRDETGVERSLSDFKGKVVVLEWFNPECPFVKKHYGPKHMQQLQKEATSKGVAWLTINSSAPGKQGSVSPEAARETKQNHGMNSTALLLDPTGSVGRSYGARTTPHMFVIDANGVLAYTGAIDNKASTDPADIEGAENYVMEAVDALLGGKSVALGSTEPYGCSVKYAS